MPVRRVAELAAALELAREEARNVVARGVGDRAGIRLERLHEHASWRVPAAAARELGQQLERPLLRAEVGVPEAGVGVDHRGQRDTREVVALGDHLRAHEHHALGVGKVAKRRRDRARAAAPRPRRGESARAPARAARARVRAAACLRRAASRPVSRTPGTSSGTARHARSDGSAATLPGAGRVRRRSSGTERRPAGAAMQRGRHAAPVEEQDRLPAPLGDRGQLGQERRRDRVAGFPPQVDDANGRQLPSEPAAELEPLEPLPALGPGRGAPVEHDRSVEGCPLRGDRPGVVAGPTPACTRRRAPRRRRSRRGRAPARTTPSARRRRSRRPGHDRSRSSRRSASVSAEWRTATRSPKRAAGVRPSAERGRSRGRARSRRGRARARRRSAWR